MGFKSEDKDLSIGESIAFTLLLLFFAIAVVAAIQSFTGVPSTEKMDNGSTISVTGAVTKIDASSVPVDGPYLIEITTEGKDTYTVEIPSMGINQCPVKDDILDTSNLTPNTSVSVRGKYKGDKIISPCDSDAGFFRRETAGE